MTIDPVYTHNTRAVVMGGQNSFLYLSNAEQKGIVVASRRIGKSHKKNGTIHLISWSMAD